MLMLLLLSSDYNGSIAIACQSWGKKRVVETLVRNENRFRMILYIYIYILYDPVKGREFERDERRGEKERNRIKVDAQHKTRRSVLLLLSFLVPS
jgi:hypothetical protein